MFDQFLNIGIISTLDFKTIFFNIILSLVLVLIISWVYRRTHQGLSYSQSFNFTLIIIGLLICVVMMIIGSNIAIAFGALGAFSLIRFRTAVKDAKDIAFVFFAVAIGMAVGTGNYMIAVLSVILISVVIVILDKIDFGSVKKFNYVLTLSSNSEESTNERMKEIFKEYLKTESLLNANAREQGKILDLTFNINLIKDSEINKFINELSNIDGINNVNLISAKSDIEY
ncbi:DUF4956 domain-containing protein [bacterium]|nr:DUF4956 domain-containing protein [bacterium]